jgi:YebC/PmpR family DNA-binding regulatory protein
VAGHSKWHNIRAKKSRMDARKGKLFTKLAREIQVAAKNGGPNPETNVRLRIAIDKALAANMPKENIERAIKKGTGELGGENIEEVTYEGYGPGGVAILVEAMTDNRNRTAGEIRHIFSKYGGSMAEAGAVAWIFERKGVITIKADQISNTDEFMLEIIDLGAEDVKEEDEVIEIVTDPKDYTNVLEALKNQGIAIEHSELTFLPKNYVAVSGETAEKLIKLIQVLEDHDDVQNVHANFDISPEELEALMA